MNKFITASAFVVALGLSTSALASGFTGPQQAGGFQGPGLAPSSVAEALKLNDDTPVVLVGQIEKAWVTKNICSKTLPVRLPWKLTMKTGAA